MIVYISNTIESLRLGKFIEFSIKALKWFMPCSYVGVSLDELLLHCRKDEMN